jgi:hypothetical protein
LMGRRYNGRNGAKKQRSKEVKQESNVDMCSEVDFILTIVFLFIRMEKGITGKSGGNAGCNHFNRLTPSIIDRCAG